MKQTSQRSLLFRQNVNRTEAEWVHFLDGYRKALIEFDMKKFGDDWHTAEDIVEEIFLNIVRESVRVERSSGLRQMRGGCAALFMRLPKQSCRKRGECPFKENYALLKKLSEM